MRPTDVMTEVVRNIGRPITVEYTIYSNGEPTTASQQGVFATSHNLLYLPQPGVPAVYIPFDRIVSISPVEPHD